MSDLSRRTFIGTSALTGTALAAGNEQGGASVALEKDDRDYWVSVLTRIAHPVLSALSQGRLKAVMPVEASHNNVADRRQYTYLEALGRLLTGIAPWLENTDSDGPERQRRQQYCDLARQAIAAAVDPSPDYMNFSKGQQPVVDTAFLALGILLAPRELWAKLDRGTKVQLIEAVRSSRAIQPGFNNWLLFSATVEAFLCFAGEPWNSMRVDYAIRQHEEWYKGDGVYGDGPQFHLPPSLGLLSLRQRSSRWQPARASCNSFRRAGCGKSALTTRGCAGGA